MMTLSQLHPLSLFLLLVPSCHAPSGDFSLLETAPLETSMGSADLPEFKDTWLALIEGAKASIELSHFYASNEAGSALEPIIGALEAAAARGVRIRFLADEGFYGTYPKTLDRLAAQAGIVVRRLDLRERTGGVLHAKYMLVDETISCVGSANFDWRSLEHIQELGALVHNGKVARAMGDVFEYDWALAGGEPAAPGLRVAASDFPVELRMGASGVVSVTPVFSPRGFLPTDELWDLPRLVEWIDGVREELRIQVLTFRMTDREGERFAELESAILRAAERGVRVQLMVADWGKRRATLEGLQELARRPGVEVRMVTVPPAARGHIPFARVIHAKYMVVDGNKSWIGSSNWEKGYFYQSRNMGLLVEGEACATGLKRTFEQGWNGPYSYPVEPGMDDEVPRIGLGPSAPVGWPEAQRLPKAFKTASARELSGSMASARSRASTPGSTRPVLIRQ